MRNGYWVVALFATGWASAGLLVAGYAPAIVLLPALLSAALLVWAYRTPGTARDPGPRARALIARWSLIEGVAIVVAINLLRQRGHADALFPAVAVIVGLHFVPLARGIPIRPYYATAAGLVLVAAAAMLLPAPHRPLAVGLGAAVILWATAVWRIAEARRSASAATV